MTTKRNLWPRRLAIPGIVLATAGTLIGGAPALPGRQQPARPMNILLMGTDERDTISDRERHDFHAGGQACGCTDVLMLVHLSARRDRVSVVSLPRDSWADIPSYRTEPGGEERPAHAAKLNAAFQEGGPDLAIRTVESMTKVSIDRYLRVDFRQFIDTVDDVGGVEVCTARPLHDKATMLDLKAGRHRLSGGRSLQYVRSRKLAGDTSADLGRIQRQQRFLVNALRQVQVRKLLTDPRRTARMLGKLLGQGPQGFSAGELVELAAALHRVPASATEFATVPVGGFAPDSVGIGSALAWDHEKADALFAKVRKDQPLVARGADPRPQDPPTIVGSAHPVRGSAYVCR